ncbi:hypothetical protein ABIC16_002811 [Sphingomonas sp. PvP055]|uniref:DUF2171 domain-containing protein n=1 Tax=Sphingomonas sp. PvP055 TaxID=3156391 RepID=UPI003397039D
MADERYSRSYSDRPGNLDQNDRYGQSAYGDRGNPFGGPDRHDDYGPSDRSGYQGQGGSDRYGARGYGDRNFGQETGGSYGGNRSSGDRFQSQNRDGRDSYGQGDPYGNRGGNQAYGRSQQGYGRQPQGYDYDDRGFFDRAGDEVRSWFGDDEAQRRREFDARYDDQRGGNERGHHDENYGSWRRTQIEALDRDYDEYRRENRSKFESEFGSWRSNRQTQRSSLSQVTEHMEVVGSDGAHVGTVDKVRGDRIILTKTDADAGGRHHSIPSSWLQTVADKVTISKSAEDAKAHWRDEERNQALFGENDKNAGAADADKNNGPRTLNRSFGGTY